MKKSWLRRRGGVLGIKTEGMYQLDDIRSALGEAAGLVGERGQ